MSYLTDIQHTFLDAFAEYGNITDAIANSNMTKANLRAALKNPNTEFHKQFSALMLRLEQDYEYGKLKNLEYLASIRDTAFSNGDFDTAMKAIDAINKMSGNFAPVKKEVNKTSLNIQAKIGNDGVLDMTKKKEQLGEADYE